MSQAAEIQTVLTHAQEDPVSWVRDVLGEEPWSKQCEIMESVRDNARTAVRSCHGAGKSYIAARIALWFLCCYPDSIVATTAPTFRQVKRILWQELRRAYNKSKFPLGGSLLNTELNIDDGWFAFGFSTDDPDSFQGLHASSGHVLVIFDEASGIDKPIWTAADGILSSAHCRFLSIGNPTDPNGPFADEFKQPGTSKHVISAFDTPNFQGNGIVIPGLVTEEWAEDKRKRWGEGSPLYQARVKAEFPEEGEHTLIPLSWIERGHRLELEPGKPNELGVDVARYGNDRSIAYHRRDHVLRRAASWPKQSTMETAGKVVNLRKEKKAEKVKVDVIGVGAGVVDRLEELKEPVIAANASSKPTVTEDSIKFVNARAQWFWKLRELFEAEELDVDPLDEDLTAELSSMRWFVNSKGAVQIESKEDMKKRGMKSPDHADAAAIAMADIEEEESRLIFV